MMIMRKGEKMKRKCDYTKQTKDKNNEMLEGKL